MPIYIKRINGHGYYYEQHSKYRPGLTPRSVMRYIGPVKPKRKRMGFIEATFGIPPLDIGGTVRSTPDDIAAMMMEKFPPPDAAKKPLVAPVPIEKPAPSINFVAKTDAEEVQQKEPPSDGGSSDADSSTEQSNDVASVGNPAGSGSNEPAID